jgi:TLC domain
LGFQKKKKKKKKKRKEMYETLPVYGQFIVGLVLWFGLQRASRVVFSSLSKTYVGMNESDKSDWDVRVVAATHATLATLLAGIRLYDSSDMANDTLHDRLYGYDAFSAMIVTLSAAYFAWDLYVSASMFALYGVGFVVHAVLCLVIFSNAMRPFSLWYGSVFLMYEATGLWTNGHYILDKLGYGASLVSKVNGALIILTFFGVRICFGNYMSYHFWLDFIAEYQRQWSVGALPASDPHTAHLFVYLAPVYLLANLVLNGLNVIWIIEIFKAAFGTAKEPIEVKPKAAKGE